MKQLACHLTLLITVASLVMFTNLGAARLWDRDEPRNAGCAREMIQRSDWVTPMFNGQLRDAKPVLLYWLIMSAYAVFGVNEFAARFWSAALAIGTVLATYAIGRRLFNPIAALWGALALATSLMFDVAGRAATPDSVLIFCSTLALMVYVLGAFPQQAENEDERAVKPQPIEMLFPSNWLVVAGMYAVMGFGVLAKGPVGLVLPTAVIGMFLLIVRLPRRESSSDHKSNDAAPTIVRWLRRVNPLPLLRPFEPLHFLRTCWHMRPITAIVMVLLVAAPWYLWVGLRTDGEFLRGFFLNEHFGRATTAMENHDGPIWFYGVAILIGFFPWSVFIVPTFVDLVRRIRERSGWHVGYIFLACWVGVWVGIFSLAKTKLPSYVTPSYPALALMTGCFIYHWTRGAERSAKYWPHLALASLAIVGIAMMIGLPLAAREFLPGEEWLGAIGLIPFAGAVAGLLAMLRSKRRVAGVSVAISAIALVTVLFGFATIHVDRHQQSHVLFNAIARQSNNPQLGAYGCLESSWVFYAGRTIRELKTDDAVPSFFNAGNESFLITTKRHAESLKKKLPADVQVLAEARYFLNDENLVLLGRPSQTPVAHEARIP